MSENNTQQQSTVNPNQIADQLADTLWKLTAEWGEFAKSSVGLPLTRAVDGIGMQLAMSLGRKSVKEHLQHVANARKNLTPASYWLQRANMRGLIEQDKAKELAEQMAQLAKHLDQHAQTVMKATNEKIAEEQQKQKETKANPEAGAKVEAAAEQAVAH
jgi:four helix bundle protein